MHSAIWEQQPAVQPAKPRSIPLKTLFIALALGLVSALGFAPLNWWPLTLLTFAALMWLTLHAPRLRTALGIGWWFGVGHFSVGLYWIATAFTFQQAMPQFFGPIAVVVLSLYLAVYPMLAVALAWWLADRPTHSSRARIDRLQAERRARIAKFVPPESLDTINMPTEPAPDRNPYAFVLLFAAAWIVTEYLRALMFTGFAWNPLAAVLVDARAAEPAFVGLTRVIGTYGLSGGVILLAGIWLIAVLPGEKRQRWRRFAMALIAAMLCQILSAMLLRPLSAPAGPRITVVQPNINQNEKWDTQLQARNFARLKALSNKAGGGRPPATPRLLLWPEAATADYLELQPEARERIAALLGPRDIIFTGGDALEWDKDGNLIGAHNSLFAMDAKGDLLARYDKAHLVPYGEYLPMRPILSAIGLSRLVPGDIDFWAGKGPASFAVPGFGKAGVQICYEIIFSGQVVDANNRPDFLFNPSNDAWFGRFGPPQHLAQARLRAVEEAMPIIRSTPTGISAVIDADGRLLESIPWRTAGAIDATLPAAHPPTLFARLGNLLPMLFALLLAATGIAVARKPR
jgi:apolipoprotein N-acyltransferase